MLNIEILQFCWSKAWIGEFLLYSLLANSSICTVVLYSLNMDNYMIKTNMESQRVDVINVQICFIYFKTDDCTIWVLLLSLEYHYCDIIKEILFLLHPLSNKRRLVPVPL